MNYINKLKEEIELSNKKSVADKYELSITHLNNLLSGRRQISQALQDKIDNIYCFCVPVDSYRFKIFSLVDKDKNQQELYEAMVEYYKE